MITYVVVFAFPADVIGDKVLLVLKDRPKWCAGRLNLPGGKVEKDESVVEAAVRELKEETGLEDIATYDAMVPATPDVMGQIVCEGSVDYDDCVIHCVRVEVCSRQPLKPRAGETESVAWHDWRTVKDDPRLLPNLKVFVPLMKCGVTGWTLRQNDHYSVSVNFIRT